MDQENSASGPDDSAVDLVVLMGQTVDPDFDSDYDTYFNQATAYLRMLGIPWVSTGGLDRDPSVMFRGAKVQSDQDTGDEVYNGETWTLSLTGRYAPKSVENIGEYTQRVPVHSRDGEEVLSLYIIDSLGGYDCQGEHFTGKSCVSKEAVKWFASEVAKAPGKEQVLFTTNPLPEFMEASNECTFFGQQSQPVCCQAANQGLFKAAKDSGKIGWIISGGDASNDFVAKKGDISLAYARKSGFGGNTGTLMKGARVVRINVKAGVYWTTSWIRDYEGQRVPQNTPAEACSRAVDPTLKPNSSQPEQPWTAQTQCCSIYAKDEDTRRHQEGRVYSRNKVVIE